MPTYNPAIPTYGSVPGRGAVASTRGGLVGTYNPQVPNYAGPTTTGSTGATDLGDVENISDLTEAINQMNVQAQQAANVARIPGAAGLEAKSSELIGQELAGQVPQDVLSLLTQQAAERGVATGMPMSPNANAAYLRALGLTSLGQIRTGMQDLTGAYGRNPAAPLFDPTQLMISPVQSAQLQLEQERQSLAEQEAAQRYAQQQEALQLEAQRQAFEEAKYYDVAGRESQMEMLANPDYWSPTRLGDPGFGFTTQPVYRGPVYSSMGAVKGKI